MAANPISFTEIDAFCRLNGLVMSPWELSMVRRLDALALMPAAERDKVAAQSAGDKEKAPATPSEVAEAKQIVRGIAKDRRVVKRSPKQPGAART
jgi:hypothetical protein